MVVDLIVRVLLAAVAFAVTGTLVRRWPRLLLARSPVAVALLALTAAAGGALAEGAPTALPAVDMILRAVLAAAVTVASARARRPVWLFASTATVVAGAGASFDWLAFVATGATLALLALGRRSWIVGATIGACLSQVLLRLDLGGTTGTSATVAGGVAMLLVVSGLRRARRSTRRRTWLAVGGVAGAALVFSAAGGLAAARATDDVRLGIDAGKEGLGATRRGDVSEAAKRFDSATDAFGGVRTSLHRWWVRPALAVPVVAHQLRAARTLSAAGQDLAQAAASSSSSLNLKDLQLKQGAIDLAAVDRAAGALHSARQALDRAAAEAEEIGSPWLVAPLVEAISELNTRIAEARRDIGTAIEVVDLAGPMLGRDGPRRWFVAVVTPAENRGSGGLIGNTAEITADGGKLSLVAVERIVSLNQTVDDEAAARVLPMVYATAYSAWRVPGLLQNATVAADFPTTAEALESVLPLAGRGEVDGTISIDPFAVAALLDVVGPVRVPSWPVPISAANAVSVLLHEQYVALGQEPREYFLGEVVAAVWARATSGQLPSPAALARKLGPAVQGRHIQLHSRRAEEQAALGRLRADGALPRFGSDHLGLVTDNASQSKADWFLQRAVDYHVRYDPGAQIAEGTVKVTLTNEAPLEGLPTDVLGGSVVPRGHNRQIVQVYTPLDLRAATIDGRSSPATALRSLGRPGNWAHELDVVVPPKSAITIELRLAGRLAVSNDRLTLELNRQAAVRPDQVTVTVDLVEGWRIASTGGGLTGHGQTASAQIRLDRNERLWVELAKKGP